MTLKSLIADGLQSLATRMGTSLDKAETAVYVARILTDAEIEAAFRTSWVIRKTVKLPALDATRKWRQWTGDNIEPIEDLEKNARIQVRQKVYDAQWKARLFGGAAILIGLPDPDFTEPVDVERVGKDDLRYLSVLTRHDLAAGQIVTDPRSELFGKPAHYDITTTSGGLVRVHPSRLVLFEGETLPRWQSGTGQSYGWGDSVLQGIYEACRNLDSTMGNIASLVFDAKTDVIKIPGLTENITDSAFETALLRRFQTARMLKGNNGTLILDGEEEYESKNYSFGGLDAIADRFMQVAAGAADIPMTRFLGMSPGGLNSTGEGDLANYYDHIASTQTLEIEPAISTLDEVLVRSALGDWPKGLKYEWLPLRQMTEAQISELRSRDAETVAKLAGARIYPDEAVADVGAQMFQESGIDVLADAPDREDDDTPPVDPLTGEQAVTDAAPRTLYVRRNVLNAAEIIAWAKDQGFETALEPGDLHVTIAFSRRPVDWMKVGSPWEGRIELPEGGSRLMDKFGEARVLLFASSQLSWRHEEIKREGASWDHPEYQPHITISYDEDAPELADIEPYRGKIVLGPEIFEEVDDDWKSKVTET